MAKTILLLTFVVMFIIGVAGALMISNAPEESKIVKCYDYNNNVIQGATCLQERIDFYQIGPMLLIMGIVVIILVMAL